jgi:aryl-alcohol dehydrogenase-like predicted oxidoreductase
VKLALGTAQFGMPYGIANRSGQVTFDEVGAILDGARQVGIDTIDTAIGYADSEDVLGRLGVSDFRVITKLSEVPDDVTDVRGWIIDQVDGSLNRLRISKLSGLLLHRPQQLLNAQGIALASTMEFLKTSGRVEKVGVSIYDPNDLSDFQTKLSIDLVQAPLNIIDHRLISTGWLARLSAANVEVHIRSLFLQGLLLMAPADRPPKFAKWADMWQRWDGWVAQHSDVGAAAACIAFGQKQKGVSRLVVGVDSAAQLSQLAATANRSLSVELPELANDDEQLINPGLWGIS